MNPSHMTLEDLTNKFVEGVKYLATDRTCEELRQTLQKVRADVAVSVETLNADLDEVRRRLDVYDNTFDGSEGSIDHVLREHARVLQEATERIERVETTLRDTEVAVKGLERSQAGVVYEANDLIKVLADRVERLEGRLYQVEVKVTPEKGYGRLFKRWF